ncbi:MAG: rhamnan synthesis F family protein [Pseudomonadota bacterium]
MFSSYLTQGELPGYVRFYLTELRRNVDTLVYLHNDDVQLSAACRQWLGENRIELYPVKNEGLDFGMWGKGIGRYQASDYSEIVLANDSCIVFASLDVLFRWCRSGSHDFCGVTDSNEKKRHLQSYFIFIKQTAAERVLAYFAAQGIIREGYEQVVNRYEIGLSQDLLDGGFRMGAYFSVAGSVFTANPSFYFSPTLLRAGMPMIKRKLVNYGYPAPVLDYLAATQACHSAKDLIKLIRQKQGLSSRQVDALFGQCQNEAKWSVKLKIALRNFRRRYVYPLFGIQRTMRLLEHSDFERERGYRVTGPDGGEIKVLQPAPR